MVEFHQMPLDLIHEVFVNDDWVSLPLLAEQGVDIRRGRMREGVAVPDFSSAGFTINNTSGDWSLRNPMSTYAGHLRRNQPFRLLRRLDRQQFGTAAASSWSATLRAEAFTNTGTSPGTAASDFNSAAGVGTHRIAAAGEYRMSYLAGVAHENIEVLASWRPTISNVTGGKIGGAIVLRGQSTSSYVRLSVEINANETTDLAVRNATGTAMATPVAGPAYTGAPLRIRAHADGQTYRMRVWNPAVEGEPYYWHVYYVDVPDSGGLDLNTPGWIGFRSHTDALNTNGVVTCEWDDIEVVSPRYYGEIASWPRRWDVSGLAAWVPTSADGILRRLGKGGQLQSTLRRALPNVSGLIAYWPCEEEQGATRIASAYPDGEPMGFTYPPGPDFAAFSGFDASLPIPTANLSRWLGKVQNYTATGAISLRFLMHIPDAGVTDGAILAQIYTSGTAMCWELVYGTGGTVSVRVFDNTNTLISTSGPFGFNLNGHHVRFCYDLQQNGADVNWSISAPEVGQTNAGANSGTIAGRTIDRCRDVRFAVGNILDDVAFGHVTVQSEITSVFDVLDELNAYTGEPAGERIQRLVEATGTAFSYRGDLADTVPMGPQRVNTLLELLRECVETDLGTLYESRFEFGLVYAARKALYNQATTVTLDFSNHELSPPFDPTDDDDTVVNLVTVSNTGGSSAVAERTDGNLSTAAPPDGIGVYDAPYTVSVYSDNQLPDLAGWLLSLGTVDQERYPALGLNLANQAVSASPALSRQILDLDIDRKLVFTAEPDRYIFDDVHQLVRGYVERLTGEQHSLEAITVPEIPYQVAVLDAGYRLPSASSTLERGIDATQTSFTVAVGDPTLWNEDAAQFPYDLEVGGERMTVSSISTTTPAFIAAGTAAAADNASVVPGLPGGSTGAGHLLLVLAGVRDLSAVPTISDSDYQLLCDAVSVKVWGKIHDGSEVAPTIGISGGAAGMTVQAQMASFSGIPLLTVRNSAVQGQGPLQDMPYPALYTVVSKSMAIYFGWKMDDWTSVATVTGGTEIGEPSSTLGSDQGIVWDYRAYSGPVASPSGSFVVTGGTSAISRTGVFVLGNWQTFTVTRSVNNVVKSHAAGTPVRVIQPAILGL